LLFIRKGQRLEALSFLEEAVRLAPDYGLFHFRLAENSYLFSHDAQNPQVTKELKAALELIPDDGWVNNFAAQIKLACGDLDAAEEYLKKAACTLGEVPAIRVNRGALCYLKGSLDEALKILNADKRDDPEGLMSNCAGNLLVRSGDLERADEYYRKALNIAPGNVEYISNRASCLIKLGYYSQAEDILAPASPSPEILELVSYAASQKGDYSRAEEASLAALEMKPDNLPSLFSLGWIYCNTDRWNDLKKIVNRLKRTKLSGEDADRRRELVSRLDKGLFHIINCAGCSRTWKVKREGKAIPSIKLYAMPPNDYPAGTCPDCGKTYCIGCVKKHIDNNSRFICPKCRTNLKLSDEGLKKIIYDWASALRQ
jgi:tetratricopeptide (TPR) repeat protein